MKESIEMNGGNGPYSYTNNSKFQGNASNMVKSLLSKSIQENLEIGEFCDDVKGKVFTVVDYGCSVGPNTFSTIETILEAVQLKFKTHATESKIPEFLVFFNDHVTNDFNTLFQGIPFHGKYFAAGVPGSFYEQLFPKSSVSFMHSASSLHWLTEVPMEVTKVDSVAWNKGKITYVRSGDEVVKAYVSQFARCMEAFLKSRLIEMEENGLLVILMPCRPEGTAPGEAILMEVFERLAYALSDMAQEGKVNEALIDSFNLPIFIPTASEVKQLASKIDGFSIVKVEEVYYPTALSTHEDALRSNAHIRAVMEGILSKHFGSEVIDELFKRYPMKLVELSKEPCFTRIKKMENLFIVIKKNEAAK